MTHPRPLRGCTGEAGVSRIGIAVGVAAALALAVVAVAMVTSDADDLDAAPAVSRATAIVERTDLVRFTEVDGSLGFGAEVPVPNHLAGVVTARAAEGAAVPIGSVLYEVDRRPVVMLRGSVPAYRPMFDGMSDGVDVAQLEASLVELGHLDPDLADDRYTTSTRRAVEDLQEAIGADDDGRLDLGEVVFVDGPQRVISHLVPLGVGVGPGASVLATAPDRQVVTASVDAGDAADLEVGDEAEVELPDGDVVGATITEVAAVASQAQGPSGPVGEASIDVTLTLDDTVETSVDRAPVTVRLVADVASDVLAVPVPALLALAEGGFAVEVVDGSTTRLVGVEAGAFAGGMVEVSGELEEGDVVAVPAR